MAIEKSAYVDWRDNSVTKAFQKDLKEAIEELVTRLVGNTDSTREYDQLLRGWVKGMAEALEWEPEFVEEEQDD
jgi:hypothetical protein